MNSPVLNKSLQVRLWTKQSRDALKWIVVNSVILSVLVCDVMQQCKFSTSKLYYIEYAAISILCCSIFYHVVRYLYFSAIWEPVVGTVDQKRLLQFDDKDASFIVQRKNDSATKTPQRNTTMNFSNISCSLFNDSTMNLSGYTSPSPNQSMHMNHTLNLSNYSPAHTTQPQPTFTSPYLAANNLDDDLLMEPASLNSLMDDASYQELMNEDQDAVTMNSMTTFWAHKVDDYAGLLKTSKYQLSPTTTINSSKKTNPMMDYGVGGSAGNRSFDMMRFSSAKLSHCVTNLKRWISSTVVERVAKEITTIDSLFKAKGLGDIQIGHVSLERLKKTRENHLVTSNIPTLPLLIPFLELIPNQEYLVNRIKQLSKGSCLAEFRHSSPGTSSSAVPWDEHLPTDAAIIFHLFCTYVDMQLLPLPQPGGRPFYDRYVIVGEKKSHSELMSEVKNKAKCAILVSNPLRPVLNFVSANSVNDSVPDRNNLFHVITQFLIYIKNEHGGYLESVNLDKSGLNILGILDD